MLFRTKILASAAVMALCAATAQADSHEGPSADTVVATVNGSEITLGELVMLTAQLPPQYGDLPDELLFNGLIDQLVNQQLLADTLEVEPDRVAIALAAEARSLRAGEVVNDINESSVTDEAVQAAYDEAFGDFAGDTEFNASHILVGTEEEALEVKGLIDEGADFAETAREKSTGPSGPSGGELGWFGPGMMVAPFEEAVTEMEAGDVSDPVQTQFGWHIVKLNDTRMTEAPPIEAVRGDLISQIQQAAITTRLQELTAEAEIERPAEGDFDPALIRDLSILGE